MTSDHALSKLSDIRTALANRSNDLMHEFDRRRRGRFGLLMGGQSPWAALQAWEDWSFHLMLSSSKQLSWPRLRWKRPCRSGVPP